MAYAVEYQQSKPQSLQFKSQYSQKEKKMLKLIHWICSKVYVKEVIYKYIF
jgi:hypothetical protein